MSGQADRKECAKCGSNDRYQSGKCRPCANARSAAWRKENPERNRANIARWEAENADRLKTKKAEYRAANFDKEKAANAAWALKNRERKLANMAAWRKANPDRAKTSIKAWNSANKDRLRLARKAWAAANPEKVKAYGYKWRLKNPDVARICKQNRRSRLKQSGGRLSRGLVERLFNLQRGLCACCKQPLGGDYHLDHRMPLALGGSNSDENMQLLRKRCNLQKNASHPIDFMQSKGYLL